MWKYFLSRCWNVPPSIPCHLNKLKSIATATKVDSPEPAKNSSSVDWLFNFEISVYEWVGGWHQSRWKWLCQDLCPFRVWQGNFFFIPSEKKIFYSKTQKRKVPFGFIIIRCKQSPGIITKEICCELCQQKPCKRVRTKLLPREAHVRHCTYEVFHR